MAERHYEIWSCGGWFNYSFDARSAIKEYRRVRLIQFLKDSLKFYVVKEWKDGKRVK